VDASVVKLVLAGVGAVFVLGLASVAPAQEFLRYETEDWIFTAPAALGTQADLELNGRQIQLCSDEIEALTGHRPPAPAKFTVQWVVSESVWYSGAGPTGWVNSVPPSFRLVDESTRPFREDVVRRGVCFGPHEVTHVLTWGSWGPGWANEGFAEFTDRLYDSAAWKCCTEQPRLQQTCDETGYTVFGERHPYSDLSDFRIDFEHYSTAACFWIEVHARGGSPAIRGILAGMRYRRPATTAELVVHQVNRVLNVDLRPVLARYGFEPAELEAGPTPLIPGCTLIGMSTADVIEGPSGSDTICGLAGNDRLTGGTGSDILQGGLGNDTLNARDGGRDVVRGGPGRDVARIDRKLDRVAGVERILG
jgi:hypothetical protein